MRKIKKTLAILMSSVLCASMFLMSVQAEEPNPEQPVVMEDKEVDTEVPEVPEETDVEVPEETDVEVPEEIDIAEPDDTQTVTTYDTEEDIPDVCEIETGEEDGALPVVEINETFFPDAAFREYVTRFDLNNDGFLGLVEIYVAQKIDCSKLDIKDLTGIAHFANLKDLNCNGNDLEKLDLSLNPKLVSLDCGNNYISDLNISNCTKLEELCCANNMLEAVDLTPFTALKRLSVSVNYIKTLNISKNTGLTVFAANDNELESMDFSNNPKLTSIFLEENNLRSVTFGNLPDLLLCNLNLNRLESLDFSGIPNVMIISVADNELKTIAPRGENLRMFSCADNPDLQILDISKAPHLVSAFNNGMRTIEVDGTVRYINLTEVLVADYSTTIADKNVCDVFEDVLEGQWYVNAVQFAYSNGIMNGKTATTFEPNGTLTREQFAQVLYNHAGKPAVTIENPFEDVKAGQWYVNAVLWAKENNIANGSTKDGKQYFGVGKNITREEMAIMLYKYAQLRGFDLTTDDTAIVGYKDTDKVSSYAKTAMNWAITQGVMSGKGAADAPKSEKSIAPQGQATRAECASMIKNLLVKNSQPAPAPEPGPEPEPEVSLETLNELMGLAD